MRSLTWEGSEYMLRAVEKPDYRIRTTYSPSAAEHVVFHDRKIIGRASVLDDAKRVAEAHAYGA
jgi:hypothetical protein